MKENDVILPNAKYCTRITTFEMGEKEPGIARSCGREIGCEVETKNLPTFTIRA